LERLDTAVQRIGDYVGSHPRRGSSHDDADETRGTIECDEAVGFDPLQVLAAFDRHGARAVVIGQVAGILHGSQELTGDLDLLWSGDPDEAPRFAAAFAEVEALILDADHRPLPLDRRAFALPKVLFQSAGASGDCCTPRLPWGSLDIVGVLDRAEVVSERGATVHYASLRDLIDMHRASGRPKDVRRIAELRRLAASG
jgi:hypothetical protein